MEVQRLYKIRHVHIAKVYAKHRSDTSWKNVLTVAMVELSLNNNIKKKLKPFKFQQPKTFCFIKNGLG